ncbi:MAG TPA: DUF177 domain-containing protein [Rhizomicrobium sp.]|nr:DUF177 domain-containing protein [Rhizomicrobium sp.]
MTEGLPLSHSYNLARLGNAGDTVRFAADAAQRAAIAKWAGILSLESFETQVEITKLAPNRFGLAFHLTADVTQSCVVTLEPVASHMDKRFSRELAFVGASRHRDTTDSSPDLVLDTDQEEGPEEIDSLHLDLATPVLEEFVLSLDPYPRRPGVEFAAESPDSEPPESPFAVLKGLRQGS